MRASSIPWKLGVTVTVTLLCTACESSDDSANDTAATFQPISLSASHQDPLDFHALFALDMEHVWVGGSEGALWRLADLGYGGWQRVDAVPMGWDIHALYFLDAQTGFAGTNLWNGSLIVKTTDGGETWTTSQEFPGVGTGFTRIFFTDALTGYAVSGPGNGNIHRTVDGGNSWQEVLFDVGAYRQLSDIAAAPDGTLWIAGSDGQQSNPLLISSADAGETWEWREGTGGLMINDIDIHANGDMWLTAFGAVARSTDAGLTWTHQVDVGSASVAAVAFADTERGIAVSANSGGLWTTSDGGDTWSPMQQGTVGDAYKDVWVGPDGSGYIVAGGTSSERGTLYSFRLP